MFEDTNSIHSQQLAGIRNYLAILRQARDFHMNRLEDYRTLCVQVLKLGAENLIVKMVLLIAGGRKIKVFCFQDPITSAMG